MAGALVGIELLGDKALEKKLRAMQVGAANKVVRSAMRPAMRPVLEQAKAEAAAVSNPETPSTGMLKVSKGLKLRAMPRKRGRIGVMIVTPPDSETGVPAGHVETGTQNAAAEPFLRNPLHSQASKVFQRLRSGIWTNIQKQASKGGA